MTDQTWRQQAKCALDGKPTEMFFANQGNTHQVKLTKAYCNGETGRPCPVRQQCLDDQVAWEAHYADSTYSGGVFGGTSFTERAPLRARYRELHNINIDEERDTYVYEG